MSEWDIQNADHCYQISRWSDGYFQINSKGELCACPDGEDGKPIMSLVEITKEMKNNNVTFPAVLRFHDILRSQVKKLNQTFQKTIDEASYQGKYYGVYPIKVNQMREVVEEIVDAGKDFNYGLEAGSKGELLAVLSQDISSDALTVLNGYKDEEYINLALLGQKLGRKMIIVVEKFGELKLIFKIANELNIKPMIGVRAKLSSRGSGRWASSGGDMAKFGLTAPEIIKMMDFLKEEDAIDSLKLFHFHIGSQIPDIRTIKEALYEGARFFVELQKMGANIEYFDVGGGAGLNYDGSKSKGSSSTNYNLTDYIGDVVYILKQICDLSKIKHPNIVSETGRVVTAQHSCVITNVFGKIDIKETNGRKYKPQQNDHVLLKNMKALEDHLTSKNYQDVYNDAALIKEESVSAFKLGVLTLKERASLETMFWQLIEKIIKIAKKDQFAPDEILDLENNLAAQYLCNLSIFQSAPDTWAIDQILPVAPIQRLNQEPTVTCTLADITCDSDGKVDNFLSAEGTKKTIRLHQVAKDEEYFIGLFMTGAYQDVMGDMHNLFGRLNEVHVYLDEDDTNEFYLEEIIYGNSTSDVLSLMQYNPTAMATEVKRRIDRNVKEGKLKPREGIKMIDSYQTALKSYTYLKS